MRDEEREGLGRGNWVEKRTDVRKKWNIEGDVKKNIEGDTKGKIRRRAE